MRIGKYFNTAHTYIHIYNFTSSRTLTNLEFSGENVRVEILLDHQSYSACDVSHRMETVQRNNREFTVTVAQLKLSSRAHNTNNKIQYIVKDAKKIILDEKRTNSQNLAFGRKMKFTILDESWTESGQRIAKKCQNVIEFDIFFWEEMSNSFTFIGLNQRMPKR